MTISISSVLNRLKPQPNIYQAIAQGKVIPDVVEDAKSAKASAAFFNANAKEVEKVYQEALQKKAVKNSKSIFSKIKDTKLGQKASGLFTKIKTSKTEQTISKTEKVIVDKTKTLFSKSAVKKGLKYGAIGAAVLGGLALVGYLGKKAYDAYQDKKNSSDKTSDPTPAPVVSSGVHEVQKGDNVWNIAKKDLESKGGEVTNAEIARRTQEIMTLNNLKYANDNGLVIIKPGEQIKLSA